MKIELLPLSLIVNKGTVNTDAEGAHVPPDVPITFVNDYAPSDLRSQVLQGRDASSTHVGLLETKAVQKALDSIGLASLRDETSIPHPPGENVLNLETKLSSIAPSLAGELSSLSSHSLASKSSCVYSPTQEQEARTDTELLRRLRHVQYLARSRGLVTTYAVKFAVETSGVLPPTNFIVQQRTKEKPMEKINRYASRAA